MYNESRKLKYLDSITDSSTFKTCKKVFEASELFEVALAKDLCETDPQERLDLYKYLQYGKLNSVVIVNSIINRYSYWCMENGHTSKRQIPNIDSDILATCLKEKPDLISYDELQTYESMLPNSCDRVLLEALYLGIKGKDYNELMNMSISDIDAFKMQIRLITGRTVTITDRFLKEAKSSSCSYEYETRDGRIQKMVGDNIIKFASYSNGEARQSSYSTFVSNKIKKIKAYNGMRDDLSPSLLFDSGFVNAVKEKLNGDIDAICKRSDISSEILNQYDIKTSNIWRVRDKYKPYFTDL